MRGPSRRSTGRLAARCVERMTWSLSRTTWLMGIGTSAARVCTRCRHRGAEVKGLADDEGVGKRLRVAGELGKPGVLDCFDHAARRRVTGLARNGRVADPAALADGQPDEIGAGATALHRAGNPPL